MLGKTLERIAEKILGLDEASLASLWKKYKERMEQFDAITIDDAKQRWRDQELANQITMTVEEPKQPHPTWQVGK